MRTALRVVALLLAGLMCLRAGADVAKDLKAKDVKKRLAAVATLRKDGGPEAAALLLEALEDRDWEVVERAAEALGERGGPESVKKLADVAVEGRVRRVRL